MEVKDRSIRVHSCHVNKTTGRPRDLLESGKQYIGELGKGMEDSQLYYELLSGCRCRRRISSVEATAAVANGEAIWLLKVKKQAVIPSNMLWMPVERVRVPRVDMVSRADMERAYTGSERPSKHWKFDKELQKYVKVPAPEGVSKEDWEKDAQEEIKFEQRIQKQNSEYIESVHQLYLDFRKKLFRKFTPDPFEGRSLFLDFSDQRTQGGH
jgi:hypothetical protein